MNIGIVGNEEKKFTPITEQSAKSLIRSLLTKDDVLVSGGCHLGGIDIWAEEIADEMGIEKFIYPPDVFSWSGRIINDVWHDGFKDRNLKIVLKSDVVYNISLSEYPPEFDSMKFTHCYHCHINDHVKSGGCWTAKKATEGYIYIIYPDGGIKDRSY